MFQCKTELQKSADSILKEKTKAASKRALKMGLDALAFSLKRVPWPYAAKLLGRAEGHEFCDLKPAAAWTFQDLPFTHEHLNLAPPALTASKSYTLVVWSMQRAQVTIPPIKLH